MAKRLKGRAGGWGAWPDGGGGWPVTSQGSTIPWLEKRRRLPTLPHKRLIWPCQPHDHSAPWTHVSLYDSGMSILGLSGMLGSNGDKARRGVAPSAIAGGYR